jgi:3-oxoacyl-[acyl-carrier protein] reductase
MLKNSEGSIINILNTQVNMPVKGYSSFTTAMSAMVGMTRNLALEVGNDGVRVNMIAPGFIVGKKSEHAPFFIQEKIIEQTPLKRLATPEDVANAVLFLASNLSGFVTGGYLVVDGGMVML